MRKKESVDPKKMAKVFGMYVKGLVVTIMMLSTFVGACATPRSVSLFPVCGVVYYVSA